MPDQPYKGTHRHRAPVGWRPNHLPNHKEPEAAEAPNDTLPGETLPGETQPGEPTQPFTPTFDTGDFEAQPDAAPGVEEAAPGVEEAVPAVDEEAPSEPLPAPAQPVVVPSTYQYLKRWMFVLVVAGVWIVAAAVGWGLYYWWFHSIDKTPPVFVVLVFLIVCTVGGLLIAMVPSKPLVSALAIAVMSAPFAATAGAAVLHGLYFCEWASRCFVGLIPY